MSTTTHGTRTIRVLGVRANHPGPSQPSHITLDLGLAYLKGEPVESVRLTVPEALALIESAAHAVRTIVRVNAERETKR